jgi:hypothetical protein
LYDNLFYEILNVTFPSTLEAIDVSNNILSGAISESVFSNASSLEVVNLNNNAFEGTIPASLFKSPYLLSVVLASNCFEGILPQTICDSSGLEQLILDGLHAATGCVSKLILGIFGAGLSSSQQVHGSIPACLFQLQNLSLLHMGGNSFSGSLPHVPIAHILTELVLSSNEFTGSVPDFVWSSNITKLDMSFNRLEGTLPSNMLPYAQNRSLHITGSSSVAMKLHVNQLAGTIPSFMRNLGQGSVDILEGNLFSCDSDRSDIPQNDPKASIYDCGSDSTNYGLILFGVVAGVLLLILFAVSTPRRLMKEILAVYCSQYAGTAVSGLLTTLYRAVDRMTCLSLIGMILFALLSVLYASYADVYVWTVSAIYKTGFSPAMVMFWWLCLCVGLLIWNTARSVKNPNRNYSMDLLSGNRSAFLQCNKFKAKCSTYIISVAVRLINIAVVIGVNGLYVSALVVSDYTAIILITLLLSIFKIVWNYALVRGSHFIEALNDGAVLGACLFNNLLAPLIAELFASSDCFLYIVTQSPPVTFNYNVYLCPTTKTFEDIQPCNFPALIAAGDGTPVALSIIPPFHYSYQCSFSLISSYVYVFIFRYVISGIIEPIVYSCVYRCGLYIATYRTMEASYPPSPLTRG